MKANRKAIMNDEEAVSPVIAVILMVAITVVLAATVFVLVNELGQDVGSTGPTLGLTTHTAGTDSDQWSIAINSATRAAPVNEYTFLLTVDGTTVSSQWRTETEDTAWYSETNAVPNDGTDDASSGAYFEFDLDDNGAADACYQLTHTDIGTDEDLRVGDRLVLKLDSEQACSGNTFEDDDFNNDMSDQHSLEFIHRPSESGAGSIDRNF